MAKEHISNFLNDFSIEVTPNAAKKIDKFSDHLIPGTLIYVAHIEGTPIEETVETAKKISDQGFIPMPHFPARIIKNKEVLCLGKMNLAKEQMHLWQLPLNFVLIQVL